MKTTKKLLREILLKLANGFTYTEITEEYAPAKDMPDSQAMALVKKKVSTHYIPPDMLAIKMLAENGQEKINSLSSMTDEELVALKNKLINELIGGDKGAAK